MARGLAGAAPLSSIKDVPELSSPSLARRSSDRSLQSKSPSSRAQGQEAQAIEFGLLSSRVASATTQDSTDDAAEGQFDRRRDKWRNAIEASLRMSGLILPNEVAAAAMALDDEVHACGDEQGDAQLQAALRNDATSSHRRTSSRSSSATAAMPRGINIGGISVSPESTRARIAASAS